MVGSSHVRSMAKTSLNSNVSFAALLPNGSVGVIHISVSHAIRSSAVETMCLGSQKISFRNVGARQSVN